MPQSSESSPQKQHNNPLHGIKLERVVIELEQHYGWQRLSDRIDINCFKDNPSVKSSLKFLRKHQWARDKVEALWVETFANSQVQTEKKGGSESPGKTDPWAKSR